MKILVLFLVVLMVIMSFTSCMEAAGGRRAMNIGGIYGEEQRHHVARGRAVEGRRNMVEEKVSSTDKEIDNHHNIPRQKYDDWGGNSPDNGDSNDDGSG
ncbi:hypothetical protein COLO4_26987 [Corchorus olitorius]|uniref:Uncharacterized protein n=1 Tax=Corchorus olitorius TaxID=93759 RepID=A0A1R3HTC2_9ROSI|nr:hypothetical protein COLO4_26987 [Corchorus olitorius]